MNYLNEFEINLKLLLDLAEKKKTHLEQILNITLNQREMLGVGKEGSNNLFMDMNKEKQKLIDEILALDNVFQRKFDLIAHNFDSKVVAQTYKEEIILLKDYKKIILRIDNDIRVEEEKSTKKMRENKENALNKNKIKENRTNEVINLYKSNSGKN